MSQRVVIVEDEMFTRLGIKASVDWERYGMEVVADVGNGREGWDAYLKHRPQLLLTDIKMPVMDGMELIQKIRSREAQTKIIILTCVDEFELARKAISLGVSDYILKLTMSRAEMEDVVKRVGAEIESEQVAHSSDVRLRAGGSVPLAQSLGACLLLGTIDEDELCARIAADDSGFASGTVVLSLLSVDHSEEFRQRFPDGGNRPISHSIGQVIEGILARYDGGLLLHERDTRFILLIPLADDPTSRRNSRRLEEVLGHVRRAMKSYFDSSVTFGVSTPRTGCREVRQMYLEAQRAIESRYFIGTGGTIHIDASGVSGLLQVVESELARLVELLPDNNSVLEAKVKQEIKTFLPAFSGTRGEVQMLFQRLGSFAYEDMRFGGDEGTRVIADFARALEPCESMKESVATLLEFVESLISNRANGREYSPEIAKTAKYIRNCFRENLTLVKISAEVGLSRNYLCSLFKKEMGIGIPEYLLKCRIAAARELLRNSNKKVYEIGIEVGFSDESYFSRSFKRVTGLRPNEFRKIRLSTPKEASG